MKDGESIEEVEDLWPQLMPQGEADGLSEAGDQELGKRKSADEGEVKAKRRKEKQRRCSGSRKRRGDGD